MSLFGNKAPAGLSINTGTANTFGSSTPTSQPAAGGSLFGGSGATSKPSGLFSSTTTSTAPSAGTLFGAGTGTGTSSAGSNTTGGLFGGGTGTTANAPSQAGTLFGGMAANKPAGGSVFGSTATTATSQGTGLFGAPTAAPATGGGLFGAKPATTQSTSLFGNTSTTGTTGVGGGLFGNKPTTGGGLFGQTTQNTTQPSTSLFGQPAQTQSTSLFGQPANASTTANAGTSLFGNPAQSTTARPSLNQPQQVAPQQTQRSVFTSSIGQYTAAQTTVPGVRVDASNLRPTTRFGDLHEVLQQELERIDNMILTQQKFADECSAAMPAVGQALTYIPSDADYCQRNLDAVQAALEADAAEIDDLKSKTRACADDAKVCFRNVSALRAPAQFSIGPSAGPVPEGLLDGSEGSATSGAELQQYMNKHIDNMSAKLENFNATLANVENYLRGMELNTSSGIEAAKLRTGRQGGRSSADEQVKELSNTLRDFESGIMGVASKVGKLRDKTQHVMLQDTTQARHQLGKGLH